MWVFCPKITGKNNFTTITRQEHTFLWWKMCWPDLSVTAESEESRFLFFQAQHAAQIGASGIAVIAPSFYKPSAAGRNHRKADLERRDHSYWKSVLSHIHPPCCYIHISDFPLLNISRVSLLFCLSPDVLRTFLKDIAAVVPTLPFYYYHLPAVTGVKGWPHWILVPFCILSLKLTSNCDTMLTVFHVFFSSSGQRSGTEYRGADSLLQGCEVQRHWPVGLWPVCQPQSASLLASLRRGWSQFFLFFLISLMCSNVIWQLNSLKLSAEKGSLLNESFMSENSNLWWLFLWECKYQVKCL